MNRTVVAALACALLLSLAGCSGSDTEQTITAADVPEASGAPTPTPGATPTPTPTEDPVDHREVSPVLPTVRPNASVGGVSFPPGTDGRGIVRRRALLEAHERAAAGGGYVLVVNETRRVIDDEGNRTVEDSRAVFRVTRTGPIGVRVQRAGDDPGRERIDVYANASGAFVRETDDGNTTYERNEVVDFEEARTRFAVGRLALLLGDGDWQPTGPTSVDGQSAVSFGFEAPSGDVERARGSLLATEAGVVRLLSYRTVTERGGQRRVESATYRFDPRPNVTVGPPEWLDAAVAATRNRTGAASGSDPR